MDKLEESQIVRVHVCLFVRVGFFFVYEMQNFSIHPCMWFFFCLGVCERACVWCAHKLIL